LSHLAMLQQGQARAVLPVIRAISQTVWNVCTSVPGMGLRTRLVAIQGVMNPPSCVHDSLQFHPVLKSLESVGAKAIEALAPAFRVHMFLQQTNWMKKHASFVQHCKTMVFRKRLLTRILCSFRKKKAPFNATVDRVGSTAHGYYMVQSKPTNVDISAPV
uniref:WASH-7_N domain-containing protein n=1 Tax=Echinostoma caproni TaxID=27848 RepID=A0A183AFE9_9TREM